MKDSLNLHDFKSTWKRGEMVYLLCRNWLFLYDCDLKCFCLLIEYAYFFCSISLACGYQEHLLVYRVVAVLRAGSECTDYLHHSQSTLLPPCRVARALECMVVGGRAKPAYRLKIYMSSLLHSVKICSFTRLNHQSSSFFLFCMPAFSLISMCLTLSLSVHHSLGPHHLHFLCQCLSRLTSQVPEYCTSQQSSGKFAQEELNCSEVDSGTVLALITLVSHVGCLF